MLRDCPRYATKLPPRPAEDASLHDRKSPVRLPSTFGAPIVHHALNQSTIGQTLPVTLHSSKTNEIRALLAEACSTMIMVASADGHQKCSDDDSFDTVMKTCQRLYFTHNAHALSLNISVLMLSKLVR